MWIYSDWDFARHEWMREHLRPISFDGFCWSINRYWKMHLVVEWLCVCAWYIAVHKIYFMVAILLPLEWTTSIFQQSMSSLDYKFFHWFMRILSTVLSVMDDDMRCEDLICWRWNSGHGMEIGGGRRVEERESAQSVEQTKFTLLFIEK